MPITDLYTVSDWRQEAQSLSCTIAYDAGHPVFGGHFPGQPVVPGVCTLDMVKQLLQRALGKKLLLRSTGQVKFLRLILPQARPVVSISWQEKENGYGVTAGLKEEGADLFKMTGIFEAV